MPTKTHELQALPRHSIYGDEFPAPMLEALKNQMIEPPLKNLPPEVLLRPELEEEIDKTLEAVDLFTKEELGVDISSRLPKREKIYVLNRHDFEAYYRERHPDSERTKKVGGFFVEGQLVVPFSEGDEAHLIHVITHESMHAISDTRWKFLSRGGGTLRAEHTRLGYAKRRLWVRNHPTRKAFRAINEYLTEKATEEIIEKYWPEVGIDREHTEDGYAELLPVLDEVVAHAAAVQGIDEEEFIHGLERGMLTGDMKALRPLMMAVDPKIAYEMTHMQTYGEPVEAFARNLGGVGITHGNDKNT